MLQFQPYPSAYGPTVSPSPAAPADSRAGLAHLKARAEHTRVPTRIAGCNPIKAVIAAHRAAYDAFQIAPDGEPSENAQIAYCEASDALVASYSTTRFGALTLFEHLRWWIADEVESAHAYQPAYSIAQARVAELALFLGDGLSAPTRAAAAR